MPIEVQPIRGIDASDKVAGREHPAATPHPAAEHADVEVHRSALFDAAAQPVDRARVLALREAIAGGSYVIEPGRIADAMIATVKASGEFE